MAKLKSSQGRVVAGDTFWGREKDIEILTKRLEDGGHVLLVDLALSRTRRGQRPVHHGQ